MPCPLFSKSLFVEIAVIYFNICLLLFLELLACTSLMSSLCWQTLSVKFLNEMFTCIL